MIIGQEALCERIDRCNLDTFPHTLMLVGSKGSGRHSLCNYVANKFNLITVDITDNLTQEVIDQLNERVEPYLYIIRINDISVKEENTILKFLEEPLNNSFIILIAETDNGILQTILNRCQIWHLKNYNKETLSTFLTVDNPLILNIANTPGQVIELCSVPIQDMIELADKMITKIDIASISNTLTITDKIAWKDEKNKLNLDLFIKVLLSRIEKAIENNKDTRLFNFYMCTSTLNRNLRLPNVEKKYLFDKYLIEVRAIMRGSIV